ncbi:MAG: hypothetical protein KHX03_08650 [Clostridium sp.]|nr:hypothetical protein [Clostridium sp.]
MNKTDLSFLCNEKIRETKFKGLKIGGALSVPFVDEDNKGTNFKKPLLALEFLFSSKELKQSLEKENSADIISIKFDISEENLEQQIEKAKDFLLSEKELLSKKPLILRGANNNEIDRKLIPVLCETAPDEAIIAFADEQTYEDIVPFVLKHNHLLVLRTPIDINLAKELNILTTDKGLNPDRILIDPDMGGLGYGLDYGYSIIERIRQAAFEGDKMLNMPIIAFIGEESYRAKEAKSDTFPPEWGSFGERSVMWEISGASAMISAGADIVVLWNPKSVEILKNMFEGQS